MGSFPPGCASTTGYPGTPFPSNLSSWTSWSAQALLLPVLAWTGAGGFPAFFANLFVCLAAVGLILPNATAAAMAPFP